MLISDDVQVISAWLLCLSISPQLSLLYFLQLKKKAVVCCVGLCLFVGLAAVVVLGEYALEERPHACNLNAAVKGSISMKKELRNNSSN